MTQAVKQFCESCDLHKTCGFVGRSLEYKCERLSDFSLWYERAVDKACEFIKQNWIWNNEMIEKFCKYMEE